MGRKKIILRLLAACFFCALVLKLIDDNARYNPRLTRRGRLLPAPLGDVSQIHLTLADGQRVSFAADTEGWKMTEPRHGRALTPAVQRLLDAFEQAPLLEYIDAEDFVLRELSPADFGFGNPIGQIVLRGPHTGIKLVVGDCDAVTNSLFVSFDTDKGVCVTAPSLREFFLRDPLDYADRRVFQCNMSMVHTVVLRRPSLGDIKLVRDNSRRNQWNIAQPFEARADWDAVGRLFDTLASATVVNDFQSSAQIPAEGLDQHGAPSITLFCKNDLVGQTLVIGAPVPGDGDLTYARRHDGILTVTGSVRRLVLASAHDFRDRRLFPAAPPLSVQSLSIEADGRVVSLRRTDSGWTITAPVSDLAEPSEVAALIDRLLSLRAERFASFDARSCGPRIASATVVSQQGRYSFGVYGPTPDADGLPGILPDGSDTLFLVSAAMVSNILGNCRDPRPLLSHTVLSLGEKQVRAVSLSRPGMPDERIEKVAGEWSAAVPGRLVDEPTVRRFFAVVADVRAESVAALAPTNSLPLDGGAEISFDLDDGTSLRRTLTIGPRLENGGRAATVKGHDAVFLLSPETASVLTCPFYAIDSALAVETPPTSTETDEESK